MFWGRRDWIVPLQTQIEKKRSEMIETGMRLGFTHHRTVEISQELDRLLNEYDRTLFYKKKYTLSKIKIQTSLFKLSLKQMRLNLFHLITIISMLKGLNPFNM